ncbi:hypothetical protein evm_000729 [Chilo suppressalis]|nr:hypothetical protein evm_000729 [Chilo suppressalis]
MNRFISNSYDVSSQSRYNAKKCGRLRSSSNYFVPQMRSLDVKMLTFAVFFAILIVTMAKGIDDVLAGTDIIYPIPCRCKATCANPNPRNCKPNTSRACEVGKIWSSSNGKCIPISECPKDIGCNGDMNAVIKENPSGCPSTCDQPDTFPCNKMGLTVGCVCKPGYILSNDGKCIKPDSCPGGDPCGCNATFVDCADGCHTNYCPENDSRDIVVCDPLIDCPSGCACKYGYVRLSSENKCMLPQECPPVNCTRPNEVYDPCPSACFSDDCAEVIKPVSVCNTLVKPICRPQCVCAKGFGRDTNGDCIPIYNCLPTAVV